MEKNDQLEIIPTEDMKALDEKQSRRPSMLFAVVEKYAGPGQQRPVEVVSALTKKELKGILSDPMISEVRNIFRGRQIDFQSRRSIDFNII